MLILGVYYVTSTAVETGQMFKVASGIIFFQQMLRKPTEPFTMHFFQCLGRAKNIDRFLQHSGYELQTFLNFMLFIATNIYKIATVYDYGNPLF